MVCSAYKFRPLILVRIRNGQEYAPESRPPHLIFGRKISAPEKRLSVGQQKSSQWPTTLPCNRADCRLIARIHIRTLIAVHFHSYKMFINNFRDFGILVTLAI